MGISAGRSALVTVSADRSRMAPARAEAGTSLLLSDPTINRIRCGIIRPTNPMIPDTDTQTAVIIDAVTRSVILVLFGLIPSEDADRSPRDMILRSRAKKMQMMNPMKTKENVMKTSDDRNLFVRHIFNEAYACRQDCRHDNP